MSIFIDDNSIFENKKEIELEKLKEEGVVLEAYFGQKPNIVKMEKAFDSIINKYGADAVSIMGSKEMDTIKNAIRDEFGFRNVGIMVIPLEKENACTVPVPVSIVDPKDLKRKKMIEASRDGFRFTKEAKMDLCVMFYAAMFTKYNKGREPFTGAELTALLLHEIGHNFTYSVSKTYAAIVPFSNILRMLSQIVSIVNLFLNNKLTLKLLMNTASIAASAIPQLLSKLQQLMAIVYDKIIVQSLKQTEKEYPMLMVGFKLGIYAYQEIAMVIGKVKSSIRDVKRFKYISSMIKKTGIVKTGKSILSDIDFVGGVICTMLDPLGYLDERFADNFSAMYGYGQYLGPALLKMEYKKNNYASYIPVVAHCNEIITEAMHTIQIAFNEHPNTQARYKNIVRQLEKELDSPYNDEDTKRIIKKQIDQANEEMDKIYEEVDNIRKLTLAKAIDPIFVRKIVDRTLAVTIQGDIRHNIIGNSIYKDIDDKVYNSEKK